MRNILLAEGYVIASVGVDIDCFSNISQILPYLMSYVQLVNVIYTPDVNELKPFLAPFWMKNFINAMTDLNDLIPAARILCL